MKATVDVGRRPPARAARALGLLGLAAVLGAVLLVALARRVWLGEVVASFRWHAGWAALALACLLALQRRALLATLAAGSATYLLAPCLGLSLAAPARGGAGPELVLASANLLYDNPEPGSFEAWVAREDPDVLALQEVGAPWPAVLEGLRERYPHRLERLPAGTGWTGPVFGIAILSKLPFESTRTLDLHPDGQPLLEVVVRKQGKRFVVRDVHTVHPSDTAHWRVRGAMLARLGALEWDERALLAGDLNTSSGSPAYADLLAASGLANSLQGFGRQPSWRTYRPIPRLWTDLDHVLVGSAVEVLERRTSVVPGSDHRAVIVRVR